MKSNKKDTIKKLRPGSLEFSSTLVEILYEDGVDMRSKWQIDKAITSLGIKKASSANFEYSMLTSNFFYDPDLFGIMYIVLAFGTRGYRTWKGDDKLPKRFCNWKFLYILDILAIYLGRCNQDKLSENELRQLAFVFGVTSQDVSDLCGILLERFEEKNNG